MIERLLFNMSLRKWLYRKEIEQLKEDLFIFKTRLKAGEIMMKIVSLTDQIESYLKEICSDKENFLKMCNEENAGTYLEGFKKICKDEKTFYDYFSPPDYKWAWSFDHIKESLNKIEVLKKKNTELWEDIDTYVEKGIKNNSPFAKEEKFGQPYYGIGECSVFYDLNDIECDNCFYMGIIEGVEKSLKAMGCSQDEIGVINNGELFWENDGSY